MAQDFGIFITQPGTSVTGAAANKTLMNTSYPFIKIDTQASAGFQTLLMLITNDPPEPSGGAIDKYTVLYQFAHGYKYLPALETLFWDKQPGAGTANAQAYSQDGIFLSTNTAFDYAYLYAIADATNVYLICHKFLDSASGGSANLLTGTNVQITIHVFVEDVGV